MPWQAVAYTSELTSGKAKMIQAGNKEIGIFLVEERVYAVLNVCPHARAPICQGRVEGMLDYSLADGYDLKQDCKVLRCPWHHWEFELETGKAVVQIKQRLKTYELKVENDQVWIEL